MSGVCRVILNVNSLCLRYFIYWNSASNKTFILLKHWNDTSFSLISNISIIDHIILGLAEFLGFEVSFLSLCYLTCFMCWNSVSNKLKQWTDRSKSLIEIFCGAEVTWVGSSVSSNSFANCKRVQVGANSLSCNVEVSHKIGYATSEKLMRDHAKCYQGCLCLRIIVFFYRVCFLYFMCQNSARNN